MSQCFDIKTRLDVCLEKKTELMESLKDLRHLPPNLSEAEKRLDELKRKYKEVCDAFTKMVTNKI